MLISAGPVYRPLSGLTLKASLPLLSKDILKEWWIEAAIMDGCVDELQVSLEKYLRHVVIVVDGIWGREKVEGESEYKGMSAVTFD